MTELILLTVKDVQSVTQLGRTKIYELMRDGELPYIKIGRSVRVRRQDLVDWLNKLQDETESFLCWH